MRERKKGKVLKGLKAVWIEVKGSPRFQFWFIQDDGWNDGVEFKCSWNIKIWCESAYGRHANVQTVSFQRA